MSSLLNNLRQAEGFLKEAKRYDTNTTFDQALELASLQGHLSDLIACIEQIGGDSSFRVPDIEESKEAHEHLLEVTKACDEMYQDYLNDRSYWESIA